MKLFDASKRIIYNVVSENQYGNLFLKEQYDPDYTMPLHETYIPKSQIKTGFKPNSDYGFYDMEEVTAVYKSLGF